MKKRLDVLVVEKGLAESRHKAQALILSGNVLVNNVPKDKAGTQVEESSEIVVRGQDLAYVSRGGLKLEKALLEFDLDVKGLVCLDIGASTGGFSDCLLQNGAARVMAVDVGYGQFAWKLRQDPRVFVLERTNIRHVTPEDLPELADFATIDVSFISLKLVLPPVLSLLSASGQIVCLIKPQFEVGKGEVGKNGVVRNPKKHEQVISDLREFFQSLDLRVEGPIASPILGPKGNREFLVHLSR